MEMQKRVCNNQVIKRREKLFPAPASIANVNRSFYLVASQDPDLDTGPSKTIDRLWNTVLKFILHSGAESLSFSILRYGVFFQ